MAHGDALFLSYSRKDYYFAESLAFQLMERGQQTWLDAKDLHPGVAWQSELDDAVRRAAVLLLLASRHSLASPNVRREWQLALAQGKRVVALRLDRAALPAELESVEQVDFRGAFRPALERLLSTLSAAAGSARAHRALLPFPPWVLFVGLALFVPTAAFLALGNWRMDEGDRELGLSAEALFGLTLVAAAWLVWFMSISFLRRRMGMTRLALCLGVVAFAFLHPLLRYLVQGSAGLVAYEGQLPTFFSSHPLPAAVLGGMPLCALMAVVFLRPLDLLRWMPTGKLWPGYRQGRASPSAADAVDAATALSRVRRFVLRHDPLDAPAAQRLRQQLLAAGAQESAADDPGTVRVILLTQLSPIAMLDERRDGAGEVLAVIGTGIRLPAALDWLWRRQWIDLRAWTLDAPEREKNLPRVPEALTRSRLPRDVRVAHHLLCALIGLLVVVAGSEPGLGGSGETTAAGEDPADTVHALGYLAAWVWGALLARALLRRRIAQRTFYRWLLGGALVLLALLALDLTPPLMRGVDGLRVLPAMVFPAALAAWFVRSRERLRFWFPAAAPQGKRGDGRIGMERNWDTLLWSIAYMFAWALITGLAGTD